MHALHTARQRKTSSNCKDKLTQDSHYSDPFGFSYIIWTMKPPLIKNRKFKFNKPPHFSESRIQVQYSSFGFPRNASEYFVGSLATVAAITFKNYRQICKDKKSK